MLVVLVICGLWLLGLVEFMRAAQDMPRATTLINGPIAAQDGIIVLTGGTRRLSAGFELLDRNLGKKLFISGVYRGVDVEELMQHWKKDLTTAPDARVALGFDATDTVGNARESAAWIEKENYHSVFLVTANYHMKRAVLDFRRHAPNVDITPWAVEPENLDLQNWWRIPTARRLMVAEYNKYLFTIALNILTGSPLS